MPGTTSSLPILGGGSSYVARTDATKWILPSQANPIENILVTDGVTLALGQGGVVTAVDRLGNVAWNTSAAIGYMGVIGTFSRFAAVVDVTQHVNTLTIFDLYNGSLLYQQVGALSGIKECNTDSENSPATPQVLTVGPDGESLFVARTACSFLINATWNITVYVNHNTAQSPPAVVPSASGRAVYVLSTPALITKVDVTTGLIVFQQLVDAYGCSIGSTVISDALVYLLCPNVEGETGSTLSALDGHSGTVLAVYGEAVIGSTLTWGDSLLLISTVSYNVSVFELQVSGSTFQIVQNRNLTIPAFAPLTAPTTSIVVGDVLALTGMSGVASIDLFNLTTGQRMPNQPLVAGAPYSAELNEFQCTGYGSLPQRGSLVTLSCDPLVYVLNLPANQLVATFSLEGYSSTPVFVSAGTVIQFTNNELRGVFLPELATNGFGARPPQGTLPPFTIPANATSAPQPLPPAPTVGPAPPLPPRIRWSTQNSYVMAAGNTTSGRLCGVDSSLTSDNIIFFSALTFGTVSQYSFPACADSSSASGSQSQQSGSDQSGSTNVFSSDIFVTIVGEWCVVECNRITRAFTVTGGELPWQVVSHAATEGSQLQAVTATAPDNKFLLLQYDHGATVFNTVTKTKHDLAQQAVNGIDTGVLSADTVFVMTPTRITTYFASNGTTVFVVPAPPTGQFVLTVASPAGHMFALALYGSNVSVIAINSTGGQMWNSTVPAQTSAPAVFEIVDGALTAAWLQSATLLRWNPTTGALLLNVTLPGAFAGMAVAVGRGGTASQLVVVGTGGNTAAFAVATGARVWDSKTALNVNGGVPAGSLASAVMTADGAYTVVAFVLNYAAVPNPPSGSTNITVTPLWVTDSDSNTPVQQLSLYALEDGTQCAAGMNAMLVSSSMCYVVASMAGFAAFSNPNWSNYAIYQASGSSLLVQRANTLERWDGVEGTLGWIAYMSGTTPLGGDTIDNSRPLLMTVDAAQTLVAVRRTSHVLFYSMANGSLVSSVPLASARCDPQATYVASSLFAFTSSRHLLYADENCLFLLNPFNPSEVKSYTANMELVTPNNQVFNSRFDEVSPPGQGLLYVVSVSDGSVAALDAVTFTKVWYARVLVTIVSGGSYTFQASLDATIAYGLSSGGELAASYLPTGERIWQLPVNATLTRSSRPLVFDGALFIASANHIMRIRSEANVNGSRIQWTASVPVGTCDDDSSSTIIMDAPIGTSYGFVVALTNCAVTALEKGTGTVVWSRADVATRSCVSLEVMGGYVLATCGQVFVLDLFTGRLVTSFSAYTRRAAFVESTTATGWPAGVAFSEQLQSPTNFAAVVYAIPMPPFGPPPTVPAVTSAPYPSLPPGFIPPNATTPTTAPAPPPPITNPPQLVTVAYTTAFESNSVALASSGGVVYYYNGLSSKLTAQNVVTAQPIWSTTLSTSGTCTDNVGESTVIASVFPAGRLLVITCATGVDAYDVDSGTYLWSYAEPQNGGSSSASAPTVQFYPRPAYDTSLGLVCFADAMPNPVQSRVVCTNGVTTYSHSLTNSAVCTEPSIIDFRVWGNGTVALYGECQGASSSQGGATTTAVVVVRAIMTGAPVGAGAFVTDVQNYNAGFSDMGPYVALVDATDVQSSAGGSVTVVNIDVINGVTGTMVAQLNDITGISQTTTLIVNVTEATNPSTTMKYLVVALTTAGQNVRIYHVPLGSNLTAPTPTFELAMFAVPQQLTFGPTLQSTGAPLLYVIGAGISQAFLFAIDPTNGAVVVNFTDMTGNSIQSVPAYVVDGPSMDLPIVLTDAAGTVSFFNRSTGNFLAGFSTAGESTSSEAAVDIVNFYPHFVTQGGASFVAFAFVGSQSPPYMCGAVAVKELAAMAPWSLSAPPTGEEDLTPVSLGLAGNGTMYGFLTGAVLTAIAPSTGAVLWTASLPSYTGVPNPLVIGNVVAAPSEYGVWIINASTGNLTLDHRFATCELGGAQPTLQAQLGNRVLYTGGSGCMYLATIDPTTGATSSVKSAQWAEITSAVYLFPTVAVAVGSTMTIAAFDLTTLQRLWSYTLPNSVSVWAPQIAANGRYLAMSVSSQMVIVIDAFSGVQVRRISMPNAHTLVTFVSMAAVLDNTLIAITTNNVIAINVNPFVASMSNASVLTWVTPLPAMCQSAGEGAPYGMITASGTLVTACSGTFGAYDAITGVMLSTYSSSSSLFTIAVHADYDYAVFANGDDGIVKIISLKTGAVAALVQQGNNIAVSSAAAALIPVSASAFRAVSLGTTINEMWTVSSILWTAPDDAPPPLPTQTGPQSSIIGHSTAAPTLPWTLAPGEQLPPLGCVAAVRDAVPAFVACVNRDVITAQLHLPLAGIDCTPVGAAFQRCVVLYTNAMIETGCGAGVGFLAQHLLPAANASASLPLCRPAGGSACATGDFCAALAVPSNSSLATAQHLPPGYAVYPSGAIPAFAPVPLATTTTAAPTTTTTTTITTTVAPNTTTAVPNTTTTTTTTAPTTTTTAVPSTTTNAPPPATPSTTATATAPVTTSTATPTPATTSAPPPTPTPTTTAPSGPPVATSLPLVAMFAANQYLPSRALLESSLSGALFNNQLPVAVAIVDEQFVEPKFVKFEFLGQNAVNIYATALDYGLPKLAEAIGATSMAPETVPPPPTPAPPKPSSKTGLIVVIVLVAIAAAFAIVAAGMLLRQNRKLQAAVREGDYLLNINQGRASSAVGSGAELRTVDGGSLRDIGSVKHDVDDDDDDDDKGAYKTVDDRA
jgi:hypothetical protein